MSFISLFYNFIHNFTNYFKSFVLQFLVYSHVDGRLVKFYAPAEASYVFLIILYHLSDLWSGQGLCN